jgi:hypothetical protein
VVAGPSVHDPNLGSDIYCPRTVGTLERFGPKNQFCPARQAQKKRPQEARPEAVSISGVRVTVVSASCPESSGHPAESHLAPKWAWWL